MDYSSLSKEELTEIIRKLEMKIKNIKNGIAWHYEAERSEVLEQCEARNYEDYGYDTAEDMLDEVSPTDELENTIREQGYLQWVSDCVSLVDMNSR